MEGEAKLRWVQYASAALIATIVAAPVLLRFPKTYFVTAGALLLVWLITVAVWHQHLERMVGPFAQKRTWSHHAWGYLMVVFPAAYPVIWAAYQDELWKASDPQVSDDWKRGRPSLLGWLAPILTAPLMVAGPVAAFAGGLLPLSPAAFWYVPFAIALPAFGVFLQMIFAERLHARLAAKGTMWQQGRRVETINHPLSIAP